MTVYEKFGIKGSFEFRKVAADSPETEILATYTTSSDIITEFSVQVAVPKFMSLKLSPASGSVLGPSSSVTQKLEITNSQHGQVGVDMHRQR